MLMEFFKIQEINNLYFQFKAVELVTRVKFILLFSVARGELFVL